MFTDPYSRRAGDETVRQRSYTRDDGIDREALARRNAALMLAQGETPARVAAAFPELKLCPYCGAPRKGYYKTCTRRECVTAARSRPKSPCLRSLR